MLRMSSGATDQIPFWLVPVSSFGTAILTTFISSSLPLPIPVSLAPRPHGCLESLPKDLTVLGHPYGGYIVRRASYPTVTSDASP
ncbi:protein of unknown function (plasmid) [Cupriavidus taiwanensis]|nr:protein of unknown function [Cupriavidus taiwanensis]SPA57398.1 protein of unknown function [Cupriavidus taiwanensis]